MVSPTSDQEIVLPWKAFIIENPPVKGASAIGDRGVSLSWCAGPAHLETSCRLV